MGIGFFGCFRSFFSFSQESISVWVREVRVRFYRVFEAVVFGLVGGLLARFIRSLRVLEGGASGCIW